MTGKKTDTAGKKAQHEATVKKLESKKKALQGKPEDVRSKAEKGANRSIIPDSLREHIMSLIGKVVDGIKWVLKKLEEMLKGLAVPFTMFGRASGWSDIQEKANSIASTLDPAGLKIDETWKGSAAEAYGKQIPPQSDAASKVSAIAGTMSSSLTTCAVGGVVFYAGVAAAIASYIGELSAETVALGSGIGTAPALGAIGLSTGKVGALLSALIAVVWGLIKTQTEGISSVSSAQNTGKGFPGQKWPIVSGTHLFNSTHVPSSSQPANVDGEGWIVALPPFAR